MMATVLRGVGRYSLAVFVIASINFFLPRAMPGDPVLHLLGEDFQTSGEELDRLRAELGLDQPLHRQYWRYWQGLFQLDFGFSHHYHTEVLPLILGRARWTLLLAAPAILLGAVGGAVFGSLAGWNAGRRGDRWATVCVLALYSTPPFFLALLLLYFFSFELGWFPLKGWYVTGSLADVLKHLSLPGLVLTSFAASRNYMVMRGSVLQEKRRHYVTYARAKGLVGASVLHRHVLRNASLPLITLVALDFGFIVSGALFVEIVFSLNGMGTLIYDALMSKDYPVLQGAFVVIMLMVVAANFFADILYGFVDPRVRLGGHR